jgi:hypothetical protein
MELMGHVPNQPALVAAPSCATMAQYDAAGRNLRSMRARATKSDEKPSNFNEMRIVDQDFSLIALPGRSHALDGRQQAIACFSRDHRTDVDTELARIT